MGHLYGYSGTIAGSIANSPAVLLPTDPRLVRAHQPLYSGSLAARYRLPYFSNKRGATLTRYGQCRSTMRQSASDGQVLERLICR